MADEPAICPNGHPLAETDRFCDQCGVVARCENGHVIPEAGVGFCEVCGVALVSGASAAGFGSVPMTLFFAVAGVFIVAVIVIAFFLTTGGDDDGSVAADNDAGPEDGASDPAADGDSTAGTPECYSLTYDARWDDDVDPRPVSSVADPPASDGCATGSYVAGERITLSLDREFSDIHPVWGSSLAEVELSCSQCPSTQFTMPEQELFASPLFFDGPPLDVNPSTTAEPATETATETLVPATETPTDTPTTTPATSAPTTPPATSTPIPPTPVPATATATPTEVVQAGPCYLLTLNLEFADAVVDAGLVPVNPVAVAANIQNSPGCPSGEYVEGQVLFVAVSDSFVDIHPVWGAFPVINPNCTDASCEIVSFTMPAEKLFLTVLYFPN